MRAQSVGLNPSDAVENPRAPLLARPMPLWPIPVYPKTAYLASSNLLVLQPSECYHSCISMSSSSPKLGSTALGLAGLATSSAAALKLASIGRQIRLLLRAPEAATVHLVAEIPWRWGRRSPSSCASTYYAAGTCGAEWRRTGQPYTWVVAQVGHNPRPPCQGAESAAKSRPKAAPKELSTTRSSLLTASALWYS